MIFPRKLPYPFVFVSLLLLLSAIAMQPDVEGADLHLSWQDKSTNADGLNIERKTGQNGIYLHLATVGPNVISYTDSGLQQATTYCYRVNAFNTAGASPYSNESCATTPQPSYTLSVTTSGSGSISTSPAGITCGTTCSATFSGGTSVILNATPAPGYIFAGWSGDAGCATGSITMNANMNCTATFNVQTFTLTVNRVGIINTLGTGDGSITTNPTGINCGVTCSATFPGGASVTLNTTPKAGSIFAGWSGGGCNGTGACTITLNANISVTGSFVLPASTVSVSLSGPGGVKSTPAGIDCGANCSKTYLTGTTITLAATPAAGAFFAGWSGGSCTGKSVCTITLNADTSIGANFAQHLISKIGVFRPSTGEWLLDFNGNGKWDGCKVDACVGLSFNNGLSGAPVLTPQPGHWYLDLNDNGLWDGCQVDKCASLSFNSGELPVVGDWKGTGTAMLGLFWPATPYNWYVDLNGNGKWDGCNVDLCLAVAGVPVPGNWTGSGVDMLGLSWPNRLDTSNPSLYFQLNGNSLRDQLGAIRNVRTGLFFLDINGNGNFDGCGLDKCLGPFGLPGDIPVAGDWTGDGKAKIGVFDPHLGLWELDTNNNGKWDGCNIDKCFGPFGQAGDLPVVGDWTGSGTAKIGVFRPSSGMWYLDLNGNGKWDGCNIDKCLGPFGQSGDLPVAGKW